MWDTTNYHHSTNPICHSNSSNVRSSFDHSILVRSNFDHSMLVRSSFDHSMPVRSSFDRSMPVRSSFDRSLLVLSTSGHLERQVQDVQPFQGVRSFQSARPSDRVPRRDREEQLWLMEP